MLNYCCTLFLLFIIYSIIGYITEVVFCSIDNKRLILNRGFLLGPYLPIYGGSAVLMYIFLSKYREDVIVLFVMAFVLCSIVEFFTSYILEKIFKVRWWDYSKISFNIDGRVCLQNSILFGLGGVVIIVFINPIFLYLIESLPVYIKYIISITTFILFIIDVIISILVLTKIQISSMNYGRCDASEEVRNLRNQELSRYTFFTTRLLNAFPKIEGKNKERIVNIKIKVNKIRGRLKDKKWRRKRKEGVYNKSSL